MQTNTLSEKRAKHAAYMRQWKARNPKRYREIALASYERCKSSRNARLRLNGRVYRKRYAERIKKARLKWEKKNPHYTAQKMRIWRAANPDKYKATQLRFRLKNRDRILARRREKRRLNINGYRDKQDAWRKNNRDKVISARRKRYPIRRQNIGYRIECSLRARIVALVRGQKSARTIALLGCSIDDFKLYLESKFESGMSWENYGKGAGKWNVDHIMPCAIFDLSKPEHQRRCFHFSNLQPLWEPENIRKHAKVITNQFNLL